MHVIIDHIAAVVIGASIILILAVLHLKGQDISITAAQVDVAKSELRVLIDALEQDIHNMGTGMARPNDSMDEAVIIQAGTEGGWNVLRFYGLPEPASPADPHEIEYRWKTEGQTLLNDGTVVDTYLVERRLDGSATGLTFNNLTSFGIELREKDQTVVDPSDVSAYHRVRYLDVNIAMISTLGTDRLIEQTRWSKTFRPINMGAENRSVLRITII